MRSLTLHRRINTNILQEKQPQTKSKLLKITKICSAKVLILSKSARRLHDSLFHPNTQTQEGRFGDAPVNQLTVINHQQEVGVGVMFLEVDGYFPRNISEWKGTLFFRLLILSVGSHRAHVLVSLARRVSSSLSRSVSICTTFLPSSCLKHVRHQLFKLSTLIFCYSMCFHSHAL